MLWPQHIIRTSVFFCLAFTLIGQTLAADSPSEFTLAEAGYRYEFPRDHGSHDRYRTEWWYYTGNLTAKDGRPFGYQLTFFRRAMPADQIKTLPSKWSITQLYLAHFAVTDLSDREFHFAEKISRAGLGKAGAETGRLDVWIDRWRTESPTGSDHHLLTAADGEFAIQLDLSSEKPLVLHGTNGISRKGEGAGQASHYYSFTRLDTKGHLTIGKESFEVTGTTWMDHEFGSADLGKDLVGWDWFSLQLDNKTEVMLYRLRRADGTADPVSSGTYVDRGGKSHHLTIGDFSLEPLSEWTSATSKARYPQKWKLTIPSQQLSLELTPRMAEQELSTTRSTQVTYWEGAIAVSGVAGGRAITGHGYMELTGYAERFNKKL